MKKVWILEKLYTPEETKKSITKMEEMLKDIRNNPEATAEGISCMENTLSTLKQRLADFPEGYWLGYQNPNINEGVLRYLMATR